jgi:hypothetical protein
MKSEIENVQAKLSLARHMFSAIGWTTACLFSIYILANRLIMDKPYTILHVVAPLVLLFASIVSIRKFLILLAGQDAAIVPPVSVINPFTTRNYVNSIVWLAVVVGLLALSAYKLFSTFDSKPSPGPFFVITTFVLLLLSIKVTLRIIIIRRGLAAIRVPA